MQRTIIGFFQDDEGDWAAALECLHTQHVRHDPPFQVRPWVVTEESRAQHVGATLDCPLCDRAQMPGSLAFSRTAGPFDAETLPQGLGSSHRVPHGTWGRLRVLEGVVGFAMATDPPLERELRAGDEQSIPPGVPHALSFEGPFRIAVDFFVASEN